MVFDRAKIERLEKELRDAKAQMWKEDGDRYRILMREMMEADKQRILDNLTDRGERILFGLEAPEEGEEGRRHASRRKRRGSDVRNLREEWSDKARTRSACGQVAQGVDREGVGKIGVANRRLNAAPDGRSGQAGGLPLERGLL